MDSVIRLGEEGQSWAALAVLDRVFPKPDRDRCSNLHRFLNEVPGLHDRFEPRGEQLRGRCQWAGA